VESDLVQYKELEIGLIQLKVLEIVHTRKCKKVQEIVEILRQSDSALTIDEIREAIESLHDDGKLVLNEPRLQGSFFSHITKNFDFIALPLWLSLAAIILTMITIYVTPDIQELLHVRIISGSAVVLLIPGYGLIGLLFPSKDTTTLERIGFSFAISLALIPILWLVMTYSPLEASIDSMVLGMSAAGALLISTGAYRQFSAKKERVAVMVVDNK
jgi:hypothetical protein